MGNVPIEESTFYLENGKVVFTEVHHIKRGWCCGNGCRHCPYTPRHIKGNKEIRDGFKINNTVKDNGTIIT